jgi:hypothetical protein
LRPAALVAAAGGAAAGPARIICKQEKDLKPVELTANMTLVEFAYLFDAFEAYHPGSHMEVATAAVQQAFFKTCVHPVLYGSIKSNIASGVTPVLGTVATVMELMRDEFLLEHALFSCRLDFFRFKQGRGQSMSDAMTKLQRLGDQSTLGVLNPMDLYVMRYLTMTEDATLLEKLLEVEVPTQQLLKDVVWRFETAARTKKTLSAFALAAFAEQGAGANAVGRGRGRGRGTATVAKVRESWVHPNLPYTDEQCQKILGWYRTRELCSKCGKKKKADEKHICPASKSTCKKRKRAGPYDRHCFAKWKAPTETRKVSGQGFNDANYAGLQIDPCRLTFQMLSLIPCMPRQCLQPEVSSNAIDHQKRGRGITQNGIM